MPPKMSINHNSPLKSQFLNMRAVIGRERKEKGESGEAYRANLDNKRGSVDLIRVSVGFDVECLGNCGSFFPR